MISTIGIIGAGSWGTALEMCIRDRIGPFSQVYIHAWAGNRLFSWTQEQVPKQSLRICWSMDLWEVFIWRKFGAVSYTHLDVYKRQGWYILWIFEIQKCHSPCSEPCFDGILAADADRSFNNMAGEQSYGEFYI